MVSTAIVIMLDAVNDSRSIMQSTALCPPVGSHGVPFPKRRRVAQFQDGSVSRIATVFLTGDAEPEWKLFRIWLFGLLLAPAAELTICLLQPQFSVMWLVICGTLIGFGTGLLGVLLGVRLALFVSVAIQAVFGTAKGLAWDIAFIVVFAMSRIAGVWLW
jgi:hypothetical protein